MTQNPNPYTSSPDTKTSASKSGGRRWFVFATMIGFVGLLFTNQHYYTGRGVIACQLWQYYFIEARNGFPSLVGAPLGGPENSILSTVAIHLGFSVLFGIFVYGLRWLVLRGRNKS
jgi:hypothetical protein